MSQSLAKIIVHIVFSTKNRQPFITTPIAPKLFCYLTDVCVRINAPPIAIGGYRNHVHIALAIPRTQNVATVVKELKTNSSEWMKSQGPDCHLFHWQRGYAAFSLGESQIKQVKQYIAHQEGHHQSKTFEDEYKLLLARYNIPYDTRYIWD